MNMTPNTLSFLQSENARLHRKNQELEDQLHRLYSTFRALSRLLWAMDRLEPGFDAHRLVAAVLDAALAAVNTDHGSLLLADETTGELVFALVRGPAAPHLEGQRLAQGGGIAGWVYEHARPVLVPDVRLDPRWSARMDRHAHFQTRTLMCVPLLARRRCIGVIEALNPRHGLPFTEEDLTVLQLVGRVAALVLAEAERVAATEEGTES